MVSQYYDVGSGPLRELDFDGDFGRFYAELDASKTVAATSPATVEDFRRSLRTAVTAAQRRRRGPNRLNLFRDVLDDPPGSATPGL